MGMAVGSVGGRSGRGGRRRRRGGPIAEINVTPMVDVMLVLLIIFMVAAPMLTVGVPIDLPETAAKPMNSDTQPITVSVQPDGKVFIQETEITPEDLVPKLKAIGEQNKAEGTRIFVRGAGAANYGTVMQVMGRIQDAGFNNIGLVTLPENGG